MPLPVASAIGIQVGLSVLDRIFRSWNAPDKPDGPELATYQARGEVQSEVSTQRWVVGDARVAGVLARHVDVVQPLLAKRFYDGSAGDYEDRPNDLIRDASAHMEVFSFFGHVLSAGAIDSVRGMWVNGVRLNLAEPRYNILANGQYAPATPADFNDRATPFFDNFYYLQENRAAPRNQPPARISRRNDPAFAMWLSKNEGAASWPTRKLKQIYPLGSASPTELADVRDLRGDGLSWALIRLRQGNYQNRFHPWRRVPRIEYLVRGRGPAAPADVGGHLLDGNPAKCAYWFLTERMGVDAALIDPVWKQSVKICDDPFITGALRNPPVTTAQDAVRLVGRAGLRALLQEIAVELGLDPNVASSIKPAYDEWYRRRLDRVVRRYTGRNFAAVNPATVDAIVAGWNNRFTGSPDQLDGTRPRYRANGVIPSTAEPDNVLDGLARNMAGSIEEHGGHWYVRAGSLSVRPGAVIQGVDIVDGVVVQQLEPSLNDQPDEVRASILQNERLEFERFVMEPVDRVEANLGEIDATNRPALVRDQTDATAGAQPLRVRDLGDLPFVSDPMQAAELMRIDLYMSRWNTRTLTLTVRPGDDFQFYRLTKGEPVLVHLPEDGVVGERVGERTDSMRGVIAADPVYHENGNIDLVVREQAEETFGEKFGLVFDYNDAGDVVLVPPPPPPVEPPTCSATDRQGAPGETITRASGWQVVGEGGTGRLTLGVAWDAPNPGIVIDSTTGHLTGTIPTVTVNTTYTGRVNVVDAKGNTGSCAVELRVEVVPPVGSPPWLEVHGLQSAEPQEATTWRASIRFPEVLSSAFAGADRASWRFRLLPPRFGASVPAGATVGAGGNGGWTPPAGTSPGTQFATLRAFATGFASVDLPGVEFVTDPPRTKCAVSFATIQVKRGQRLTPTSIFRTTNNVTGTLSARVVLPGHGRPSPLPAGLALTGTNVSGTTRVNAGSYRVPIVATDQNTDATRRECERTGTLLIEVQEPSTPPTCTITGDGIPVRRSRAGVIGLRLTGFDGTPPDPVLTGPAWMTIERSGITFDYLIRIAATHADKTPGNYSFAVRSGRARCGGRVTVIEDPDPPLTMPDVTLRVKEGDAYTSGMNLTGGSGTASYAWEGAEPTEEIGLVLDARSGDFSGTAPTGANAAGDYGPYTVRGTKGSEFVDAEVRVTVVADTTPDPPTIECLGASLSGPPGGTVSTDRIECTADEGLIADHASTAAVNAAGTTIAAWTATWTFSGTLGDPDQPGSSGVVARFETTIPSGQATGRYTFENTVRTPTGNSKRVTVVVTVTTRPITLVNPDLMKLKASVRSTGQVRLRGQGGPAAGSYAFARASGPSYIIVSSNGRVRYTAPPVPASGTWSVRVTKGSASNTIRGTYNFASGGGVGPVDPEDDEQLI